MLSRPVCFFLSVIFLFGSVTDWEFDSGKAGLPEFFLTQNPLFDFVYTLGYAMAHI